VACVAHARELLQIYQISYQGLSMLTGMTEEGLRRTIEMPAFQAPFQLLGSTADLSNLPPANKQQSIAEITTFFNDPALQLFFTQISSTMEQDFQSLNRYCCLIQ
jgi:hypothetical protein